jgi:two-component system phosphate regulon sensor histidine kinase PhoR
MALTVIAVVVCSVISAMIFAVSTQNQTKAWLTKLTWAASVQYTYDQDASSLSEAVGHCRVTIISPDGVVLADSEVDPATMDNHRDRDEVQYASKSQVTISVRTSSTLGTKFMYASLTVDDGNILRLAHSYSGILHNLVGQIPAMLGAIAIVLLGSLVLAGRLTRSVTAPLEKTVEALTAGQYDSLESQHSDYYELEKIMATLRELLQQLSDSHHHLAAEQEKVDTILSNMAEGFVLLDSQGNVLLCNNAARDFFSVSQATSVETIHNLTREKAIMDAISSAIEDDQVSIFDMELGAASVATLYVSSSRVASGERGATLLIMDTTAEKHLEQKKRDLYSDASHELKTPITSILGFSEMLSSGMVKGKKDKADTIGRIQVEASRMSDLVNDILTISQLESPDDVSIPTPFQAHEVLHDVISSLSWIKDDTHLTLTEDIDEVMLYGDPRQFFHLCMNVLDNAIKYNRPGGSVRVELKERDKNVELRVEDTGIGIPSQDQVRVFDRFFRVDSARNRKTGGSGLGLAIVKHIVSLYQGSISLFSKAGSGTTLIITLPQRIGENQQQPADALVR